MKKPDYLIAIDKLDAAVCELCAVSQGIANLPTDVRLEFSSRIYARLCSHAVALIRAAPLSRWTTSEFEEWDFCVVAGHARAILEGVPFFLYMIRKPEGAHEEAARINLLHLNDCSRRLELFDRIGTESQRRTFEETRNKLQDRLRFNPWFRALPDRLQKSCLSGSKFMFWSRDQAIANARLATNEYYALFDHWSQHTHILPLSIYGMEADARGSGLENEADRSYIGASLLVCSGLLTSATDAVMSEFPDTARLRKGMDSRFQPGPLANHPDRNERDGDGGILAAAINRSLRDEGDRQ